MTILKRLFQFSNVIPTLEIKREKRLGTAKTRFYIVEMFAIVTLKGFVVMAGCGCH